MKNTGNILLLLILAISLLFTACAVDSGSGDDGG